MAWEYLNDPALDARFIETAKCLDLRNKVLVDLNAGKCNFAKYAIGYKHYYANDLLPTNPSNVEFRQISDSEMLEFLKDKQFDVLMCWGYSAGHLNGIQWESPTQFAVIKSLLTSHKPSLVILEFSVLYNKVWKMGDEILEFCGTIGYREVRTIHIPANHPSDYSEREVHILTFSS